MRERNRGFTVQLSLSPPSQGAPLGRRVLHMALLWGLLGTVVGGATSPSGGLVGVIPFVIAGVIVLLPLGAALGLVGGRVKPVLAGALFGAVVGILAGVLAYPARISFLLSVGVIGGGMAGGTSFALGWWCRFLACRALRVAHRP